MSDYLLMRYERKYEELVLEYRALDIRLNNLEHELKVLSRKKT
jgi:hypothetical protein